MRIATWNVNGINGRLPLLLEWLEAARPDIVCLQELKAPQEKFPDKALVEAGYGAIWHGQQRWNGVAILARGCDPIETHKGLPGGPADSQSRYIEAAINGILVGCLYAPNGNPQPGPKFDYKLAWNERLIAHAGMLHVLDEPVVLCGDYNIIPADEDAYKPENWADDALMQPESRAQYKKLLAQGWQDAIRHLFPDARVYTFWDYWRNAFARNAGIRIDHFLLNPAAAARLKDAGVDHDVRAREGTSDHAPTWIALRDK
ncbi:MAG: xth [Alphaproteobacteria bacterium]|nr:xth [Alphaproteobacteria bacterium]